MRQQWPTPRERALTNPARVLLHDDGKREILLQDDEVDHGCVIGHKHLNIDRTGRREEAAGRETSRCITRSWVQHRPWVLEPHEMMSQEARGIRREYWEMKRDYFPDWSGKSICEESWEVNGFTKVETMTDLSSYVKYLARPPERRGQAATCLVGSPGRLRTVVLDNPSPGCDEHTTQELCQEPLQWRPQGAAARNAGTLKCCCKLVA